MKKAAVTQGVTHTWEEVFVCVRTIDRSVESHSDPVNLPCVLSAESKFQISDHPLRHGAVISNLSHKPPLTFPFTLSTTLKRPLSFSLILFLSFSHTCTHLLLGRSCVVRVLGGERDEVKGLDIKGVPKRRVCPSYRLNLRPWVPAKKMCAERCVRLSWECACVCAFVLEVCVWLCVGGGGGCMWVCGCMCGNGCSNTCES